MFGTSTHFSVKCKATKNPIPFTSQRKERKKKVFCTYLTTKFARSEESFFFLMFLSAFAFKTGRMVAEGN